MTIGERTLNSRSCDVADRVELDGETYALTMKIEQNGRTFFVKVATPLYKNLIDSMNKNRGPEERLSSTMFIREDLSDPGEICTWIQGFSSEELKPFEVG